MIGARPAEPGDEEAVAALLATARAALADLRGGPAFAVTESTPPSGEVESCSVVGTLDDVVVGTAVVERHGPRALLRVIVTHPGARGIGIGHAMLAVALSAAERWGCERLDSYALPGDRDTKNFFESHAMKSRLLIVSTPLAAE